MDELIIKVRCSCCDQVFFVPVGEATDYICDDCYEIYREIYRELDAEQWEG